MKLELKQLFLIYEYVMEYIRMCLVRIFNINEVLL